MFAYGLFLRFPSGEPLLQAFTTGAFLITLAQALKMARPTHRIGCIVHDRLVNAQRNWSKHTIRSALETSAWLAAVWGSHAAGLGSSAGAHMKWAVPTAIGGFAGLAVSVIGELALTHLDDGCVVTAKAASAADGKTLREDEGVTMEVDQTYTTKKKKASRDVTMAELANHNTVDDCWICVEGKAYDITKYVDKHPGGVLPIQTLAGKDVTDAFANYHPARVYKRLLPQFYVGDIVDYTESDWVKDHRALRQTLLEEGLFATHPSFYVKLTAWLASLLGTALYLTIGCTSTSAHMGGAVFLALFWQQLAFLGHDIGHNAVSHVRRKDLFYGILFGNTLGGISLGWWKKSHNVHHIICNSIEHDPDIQHLPFLAVDEGILGKFFSAYHGKWFVHDAAARFFVSYQHYLYYVVMGVARFNLYVQGILHLIFDAANEHRKLEVATVFAFFAWFGTMLTYALSTWQERVAYLLVSHALAGVLHVQITLSHFAEDVYHGKAYNDDEDEWFKMQLKTTMNVDCPTWMDWFHGGLQFQVEHHLFPRVPRHNLRRVRDLTKALCAKHGVHYEEKPFFEANVKMWKGLKRVALEARKTKLGDGGFYTSQIWEAFNAQG